MISCGFCKFHRGENRSKRIPRIDKYKNIDRSSIRDMEDDMEWSLEEIQEEIEKSKKLKDGLPFKMIDYPTLLNPRGKDFSYGENFKFFEEMAGIAKKYNVAIKMAKALELPGE